MFGKKNAQLLEEAEAKLIKQQEKLDWYQRHYEKQQVYIEDLYDVVAGMSRQLGMVLNVDVIDRIKHHPNLESNGSFFLDLYQLFSTRFKKGKNVTCYYGKELEELQRRFQDRDFKNSKIVHLTERLTLDNLSSILKEGIWKNSIEDSLLEIRSKRKLDTKS